MTLPSLIENSPLLNLGGIIDRREDRQVADFTEFITETRARRGERLMRPVLRDDDPIVREIRRAVLARRLIAHGVRTEWISRLTGLTRNRLATVRRRLMVVDDMRPRGPARGALEIFRSSGTGRTEAAALISLGITGALFPASPETSVTAHDPLEQGERLCETVEAYQAIFPRSRVELEDFLLLYRAVAVNHSLLRETCRRCRCLILVEPFVGPRECWHCAPEP
jgi:hypothetical protein